MNYSVYKILLIIVLSLCITNCAKRGRPTGGKKDSIPPLLVKAIPNHKSIHFDASKIKIYFDEYIKLKDINKQLIISPPLKYNPDITPVGTASKLISIKLFDTLKKHTTYTLNFGNSIEDNNEGNPLGSFKYVFSTGDYIDSLKIAGDITDSFSRKTADDILVMLYKIDSTFNDSIIYKEKPTYVTSTLDTTNFKITNIKEGKYFLMAIKQANNNYIYSPKQDKIGFLKEPITLPMDSVSFKISLFKEINPFKIVRAIETTKGHIIFAYEGEASHLNVTLLDSIDASIKPEIAFEKGKDTLGFWFPEIEKDSLLFKVSRLDFTDTLIVKLRSKKRDSLLLKKNISSTLNPRDTFTIISNIPITKIDTSKISLLNKDTIAVPFTTKLDRFKTRLSLNFKSNFEEKYAIQLMPNAIVDAFKNANDTLNYKINTKKEEDYGIINLQVTNVNSPVIIQIITEKDKIVASQKINNNQTVIVKNLPPENYIVRAIFDDNENGKWDTGNYLLKIQPEKVLYFEKLLKLRANWEASEIFSLTK